MPGGAEIYIQRFPPDRSDLFECADDGRGRGRNVDSWFSRSSATYFPIVTGASALVPSDL